MAGVAAHEAAAQRGVVVVPEAGEVDGDLRFAFDDQKPFDVVLSWKPKRFDPGVVLSYGDCLSDGPPMPVRAGRVDGRARLQLTLSAGSDEPSLR